jgi:hypothetical protein
MIIQDVFGDHEYREDYADIWFRIFPLGDDGWRFKIYKESEDDDHYLYGTFANYKVFGEALMAARRRVLDYLDDPEFWFTLGD